MNINSVLNQSSRAIGFGNNIKSQKSQNTGFEASQPITVYMLNEKCIYSGGGPNGQSAHVMYEEGSTAEDPIVRIFGNSQSGEYEEIVHINDIDPTNATYPELCALLAHKTRTGEYTPEKGTLLSPLPGGVDRGDYSKKFNYVQTIKDYVSFNKQNGHLWLASSGESLLVFYDKYLAELSKKLEDYPENSSESLCIDYGGRLRVENYVNIL